MSVGPALALALVSTDPPENLFVGVTAIAVVGLSMIFLCRYEKHPEMLPKEAVYRRRLEEGGSEAARTGTAEAGKESKQVEAREGGKRTEAAETTTSTAQSRMEGRPKRESIASRIFEKHALPGTLPMIVLSPALGFAIFFVGLYGASLGVGNAGLFYTLSAVSMILVRLKSGAFMDRFAPIVILPVALACGLIAFAMLVACGTVLDGTPVCDAVFNLSGIVYGFCTGIALPLNQSVAVKNTPPERWGAANALFQLAIDVGIGGACVIWGIVNDCFGFPVTICCAMCCIAASYFVARAVYPKE